MEGWMGDVTFAMRGLYRRKGWTLAVLTTLAVGTGAATSLFSVSYSVLARPLPYPDPEELVRVYPADVRQGAGRGAFSMPDWEDWRAATRRLEALGLYSTLPSDLVLTGFGDAMELETAYVTSGFFETLDVDAALGRTLRPEEERGDNHVVVLSHSVWQRVFGGDPAIIGRTVDLKAEPYRVVGVMPPGFGYPEEGVELYTFLTVIPPTSTPLHLRVVRFLDAVGRLAPGATREQAQAELSAVALGLADRYPDTNASLTSATVLPLRETLIGRSRPALLALFACAGLLLAAAVFNVAGLTLVRQMDRTKEFAVRAALGAGRGRLVRLSVLETAVVASLGTALGVLVAVGLTRILIRLGGEILPRASEVAVDAPAMLFAGVAALAVTALFSLLPGRSLSRAASGALRVGAGIAHGWDGVRKALVAGQVGLACIILVLGGLLGRSLHSMGNVDPGFDGERRLVATVNISSTLYPERSDYLGFYRRYLDELSSLPGVEAVGSIRYFPTRGVGEQYSWLVPGIEPPPDRIQEAFLLQIDEGLPAALGMRLHEGRFLTRADVEGSPRIVINRTLADQAFPGESPVGRTLLVDDDFSTEVVGVVEDVRQRGLGVEPDPTIYMAQGANPRRSMSFVLRTSGDPLSAAGGVRERLRELDPRQPLAEVTTAQQVLSASLSRPRFLAAVSGAFGVVATLLALVAVGGAVAHAVGRRTREIGIRVALGERPGSVSLRMLRSAMVPALAGMGGGLAVALVSGRLIRSVLFGIAPHDWVAVGGAVSALVVASLVASLLPARRAGSVDPVSAMKIE